MSETFDLDRDTNIANNIDATGKKWTIHTERGRHLFYTRPEPDRADAVIPDSLRGCWTKKMLLDDAIRTHVIRSWDHADEVRIRNERKAQAAKEQKNAKTLREKETKVTSEKGGLFKSSKQKSKDNSSSSSANE